MPMNGMPKYMAKPNAAHVAMIADKFPRSPSHGFERTESLIIDVITLFRNENQKIDASTWIICILSPIAIDIGDEMNAKRHMKWEKEREIENEWSRKKWIRMEKSMNS